MRIVLATLVLALLMSPAVSAEPAERAVTVVDGLGVDAQTANKLIDLVTRYDNELDKLQRTRSDLRRRLVTARHDAPKDINRLLDDALANQRAIVDAEERLVTRVRQIVSAQQTAQLLVLLAATEPSHVEEAPPPAVAENPRQRSGYDRDSLFPPGSSSRPACDPFAMMHRCP
jgi:hypothetical protein